MVIQEIQSRPKCVSSLAASTCLSGPVFLCEYGLDRLHHITYYMRVLK